VEVNSRNWIFHKSVTDGEELLLEGLNIWSYNWKDMHQHIIVKDPIYQEEHVMLIYDINDVNKTVRFAAGEFSNMVWGIYLPQP